MRDIFESHPVSVLKKEISKSNIKGYSKMKKAQVVDLMMKNKEKFSYIKMAEKKERKPRATKVEKQKVTSEEDKARERLKKALKLWEQNKKDNLDTKGNPTKGYSRLKDRMKDAKTIKEINKRIDQFSQVAKIKV